MKYYEEVMVALSESIMKMCLKRPLSAKSRCRDILFVLKARNHASLIKVTVDHYQDVLVA